MARCVGAWAQRSTSSLQSLTTPFAPPSAKSTHLRLHSTPESQADNLARLSDALRTVLTCIGEDPYREGLERTPERYARALMWMTKGYEERLSGGFECGGMGGEGKVGDAG